MIENTYGIVKRLEFVASVIADYRPACVLDVGCGTGANLTAPLALRFPAIHFVGIDEDANSIALASRENRAANAHYYVGANATDLGTFDLVIASEVIEHVEDPNAFLIFIRERLTSRGRVILTLPNGFGPYEISSFVETIMHLTGAYRVLRAIKRRLLGYAISRSLADTLAVSPHVNFFTYRKIRSVIAEVGLRILGYRPRTFLCGFGFDQLMCSSSTIHWNARVADRLPPQLSSAWMFVLEPTGDPHRAPYKRSGLARIRRRLNEVRWKLK